MPADLHRLATVQLRRSYEFDPAVAVPVVVPVHKRCHPLAGLLLACEWPTRVDGPVLRCLE